MTDIKALVERLECTAKIAEDDGYSVLADPKDLTEAAAALREMERFMPAISFDGPNMPNDHRLWLARQLLDSKLTDDEAFSIARSFPSAPDQSKTGD